MRKILFMLTILACVSPKPVSPPDASDAQAAVDGITVTSTSCHDAMLHLQFFNCPEGDARDVGDNFEQICLKTQRTHEFDMHPDCINKSKNVDDLRASCNVKCQR